MHFHNHLGDQISFWAAFLVGAAHAIEPSHGKAVLLAYLVGIRGRLRDLLALAVLITLTHSLVVLALAAIVGGVHEHFAARAFLPFLELAAASLVMGLGVWMSLRNLRGDYYCCLGHTHHEEGGGEAPGQVGASAPRQSMGVRAGARQGAAPPGTRALPRQVGPRECARERAICLPGSGPAGLPAGPAPGHKPSRWAPGGSPSPGLIYLGITGGLVPCQGGLAVVLVAASQGALLRAVLLTATFSVGMGLSLLAVGLAILMARERTSSWLARPRVGSWVSWATAGLVLAMGGLAAVRALGEIL